MCFFRGLGLMVIPWLMGFPVEMRLGAVGAPEEHRKVKRGREASRNRCVTWRFLWFGKRKPKMANHLEINSIWKNLGINSIWKNYIISWVTFYMLKCIPSGKNIEKGLSWWFIVSIKVHNQIETLNQNGTMMIARTTKKGFPTWCCSIPRREWISHSKYP